MMSEKKNKALTDRTSSSEDSTSSGRETAGFVGEMLDVHNSRRKRGIYADWQSNAQKGGENITILKRNTNVKPGLLFNLNYKKFRCSSQWAVDSLVN